MSISIITKNSFVALLLLCILVQGGCATLQHNAESAVSASFMIVDNGIANARIVVPEEPSKTETFAAQRLKYYFEKMSGASLPVVKENEETGHAENLIFIGKARASNVPYNNLLSMKAPRESSLTIVSESTIYLTGIDDEGTLHAVYFLLEDLGCRWYFPFEWGLIIPKKETLSVAVGETYQIPDFEIRTGLWGQTLKTEDEKWGKADAWEWGRGNHLNTNSWWGAGHSYNYLLSPVNFKEHPDWFAWHSGKRHPHQLCTTNPEVRKRALNTVLEALRGPEGENYKLVCVSPNDGNGFCVCENCRKLVPDSARDEEGNVKSPDTDFIDRMVDFANYIAENIKGEFPGVRVTYYADYHQYGTPKIVKPADNTVLWLVQWDQDLVHGIKEGSKMDRSVENWGKYNLPLMARTYYSGWHSWAVWPQITAISKDIPYYKEKGFVGLYSETHTNFGTQHLNFILFPRMLWDTETDVDAFIDRFCNEFYGPGAPYMKKFYTRMEEVALAGPTQKCWMMDIIKQFKHSMAELQGYIKEAKEAIREDDEVYNTRIDFVDTAFGLAKDFHRLKRQSFSYGRNNFEYSKEVEETVARIKETIQRPEYNDYMFRWIMVKDHVNDLYNSTRQQ